MAFWAIPCQHRLGLGRFLIMLMRCKFDPMGAMKWVIMILTHTTRTTSADFHMHKAHMGMHYIVYLCSGRITCDTIADNDGTPHMWDALGNRSPNFYLRKVLRHSIWDTNWQPHWEHVHHWYYNQVPGVIGAYVSFDVFSNLCEKCLHVN